MGNSVGQQHKEPVAAATITPEPGAQETYKHAFGTCVGTLELVGQANSSAELEAACGWWRVCMARALPRCREAMKTWQEGVGSSSVRVEDMPSATAIEPWRALASCVESHAENAGVNTASTLQHVATVGGVGNRVRQRSQTAWVRAAQQCEPLRTNMQRDFLGRPETNERDEVSLSCFLLFWLY